MKGIDVSMLITKTDGGDIAARPMSNNKDVAEDGTSFYFSTDDGRIDNDLKRDDRCGATYAGKEAYVAVQGRGKLHRATAKCTKSTGFPISTPGSRTASIP